MGWPDAYDANAMPESGSVDEKLNAVGFTVNLRTSDCAHSNAAPELNNSR